MINIESGQFMVGENQIISSTTDLATVQAMNLGQIQRLNKLKNGWIWYDTKNVKIDKTYFNLSFLFDDKRLKGLSFVFQEQVFDLETKDWSSWSETAELENAKRFNDWLDELLGGKRDFEWGTVWAGYDPKGGASSIRLRYAELD